MTFIRLKTIYSAFIFVDEQDKYYGAKNLKFDCCKRYWYLKALSVVPIRIC